MLPNGTRHWLHVLINADPLARRVISEAWCRAAWALTERATARIASRVLSIWPTYATAPTLKHFAWSALITGAFYRNFALLRTQPAPPFLAPLPATRDSDWHRPYHPADGDGEYSGGDHTQQSQGSLLMPAPP
ncbi:hypothetical protein B0H17DRAFT_1202027 [Mycena rosella]|uniref:Uncharacterized protein n=1 Tax=Mycena rosella TaxID=1033263 RepID=A0AAD7GDN3_MYCRO|nr:hypothetical protein B0H17DRAFT_1202027 [Mycena rosella]